MRVGRSISGIRPVTLARAGRAVRLTAKSLYQRTALRSDEAKKIMFIVGCQRSGTTLLSSIFERDLRTSVYREQSRLSSRDPDRQLRLNPLDEVAADLEADPARIIVLKPLVESQNVPELLDHFDGSRAVWLYRRHTDVAASYVRRWHDRSIKDLRSIVRHRDDWRNERVSSEVRDIVRTHFSERMAPHDASALFWFSRNRHFIERALHSDERVTLCRYEALVGQPQEEIARLYDFIDVPLPATALTEGVHTHSVQRGSSVNLSEPLGVLCADLLERLDALRAVQPRS